MSQLSQTHPKPNQLLTHRSLFLNILLSGTQKRKKLAIIT